MAVGRMIVRTALLLSTVFLLSCGITLEPAVPRETEINDTADTADGPLPEGVIVAGTIDHGENTDTDVFSVSVTTGRIYVIEIETHDGNCPVSVLAGDQYGSLKYGVFPPGEKGMLEVLPVMNGTLFISIADAATDEDSEENTCGRIDYGLRITSFDACARTVREISSGESHEAVFTERTAHEVRVFSLPDVSGAYFGLSAESRSAESDYDKKLFLLSCDAGDIEASNDDRDYSSGLYDPYIYRYMETDRNYRLLVDRWYVDTTESFTDDFTVSVRQQPAGGELEPNNLLPYANYVSEREITAETAEGFVDINGVPQFDRDMFRRDVTAGSVFSVELEFLNDGELYTELYSRSRDLLGGTIVPMKFNYFEAQAGDVHSFNGFVSFTGTVFYSVQGNDVRYRLITNDYAVPHEKNPAGSDTFHREDCGTVFMSWNAPEDAERVVLSLDPGNAGLYVYDHRHRPFILLDPNRANVLALYSEYDEGPWHFGVFTETCEPGDVPSITVTAEPGPVDDRDAGFTDNNDSVTVTEGRYRGRIMTDEGLYRNTYLFTAAADGDLVLQTAPVAGKISFDTVVTVTDSSGTLSFSNDDMVESFNWNTWSYLRVPVLEGETYTVTVTPFMDESSSVSAMNINTEYILDIMFR